MRSSQPGDNGYFISNSLLLCLYIFARLFIVDCVSFISDVTIRPLLFNELTVCNWNAVAFFCKYVNFVDGNIRGKSNCTSTCFCIIRGIEKYWFTFFDKYVVQQQIS